MVRVAHFICSIVQSVYWLLHTSTVFCTTSRLKIIHLPAIFYWTIRQDIWFCECWIFVLLHVKSWSSCIIWVFSRFFWIRFSGSIKRISLASNEQSLTHISSSPFLSSRLCSSYASASFVTLESINYHRSQGEVQFQFQSRWTFYTVSK